jgi:hypothetical protein
MNVGISVTGGVGALKNVDTGLLNRLGFGAVFVACYEDELRWQVDDVAAFMRRARNDGLVTYAMPWGYGRFLDPDPSVDSLFVHTHPDTCQIDSRGRRLRKACPNHPRFLEWFSSSMRTLAWLLECRGFVWDEPTFYHTRGVWGCRCQYCTRLFRASYGREMPHELTDEVLEFRRNAVLIFLLAAAAAVQSVDRKLQSLVMPTLRTPRERRYTGTEDAAPLTACSGVDGLCVAIPWQEMGWDMEFGIREANRSLGEIARRYGKQCALWLNTSPDIRDRAVDTVRFAARAGADALVLSDYSTLIDDPAFSDLMHPLRDAVLNVAPV